MPEHNLSEAQLARLARPVRQEIERLSAAVDYWRAKFEAGPADSDTFVDRIVGVEEYPGHAVGKGTPVVFQYGPDARDAIIVNTTTRGVVEIGTGRNYLTVQPRSSNSIEVVGRDR